MIDVKGLVVDLERAIERAELVALGLDEEEIEGYFEFYAPEPDPKNNPDN